MKAYELVMTAADELDVIRVRANVLYECVRRYRVLSMLTMRQLMRHRRRTPDV